MKKIVSLIMILSLVLLTLVGCSTKEASAPQKTEEELKAELRAELEAEAKIKEELEKEIRAKLEEEYKNNEEEQEDNTNNEEGQEEGQDEEKTSSDDVLIETNNKNYYKYKTNKTVKFDIDEDGTDEEILYDTHNGKLLVTGFDPIEIFVDVSPDYFIIINFNDKYDWNMNMIGIIDYGPSEDYTTTLYSILVPRGEKWFGSVGTVEGEIVSPSQYNENNGEDFVYKAVVREGVGIEAPVRLSIMANLQTWWGRNDFTYYSTYLRLIDNIEKYDQDYITKLELRIEKDVTAYSKKDLNSKGVKIKGGQKITFIATDNKSWIKMVSQDGTMGWVNIKDITESNFSGFAAFD